MGLLLLCPAISPDHVDHAVGELVDLRPAAVVPADHGREPLHTNKVVADLLWVLSATARKPTYS
ncbi:MAG: hypothetical protein WKF76_02260 [Nocardioidaceae bacterium]